MRLAGTCRRYSKRAIPQLAAAAAHHGQAARFLRCAYHAKVMNTLEATSSTAETKTGENWVNRASPRPGSGTFPERPSPHPVQESRCPRQSLPADAARKRARAFAGEEFSILEHRGPHRRTKANPG